MKNNLHKKVYNPITQTSKGTGWWPSMPDLRDYTDSNREIREIVSKFKPKRAIPKKVDLRQWCSPIEDQGSLGSCTAHAAAGVIEYFQIRAYSKYIDVSRLFIYKATRNLLGWVGDTGANLRTTMASIAMLGVPPEEYWPYTTVVNPGPENARTFDDEPTNFVYALARNFQAVKYFTHSPIYAYNDPKKILDSVKKYLNFGIPTMFGFFGFSSFWYGDKYGHIPMPCPDDVAQWGHAIVAVGYDDEKVIKNVKCNIESKGALLIRNSWGKEWGEEGYGWIPYDYIIEGYAHDFWSLISMEWIDTGEFGI